MVIMNASLPTLNDAVKTVAVLAFIAVFNPGFSLPTLVGLRDKYAVPVKVHRHPLLLLAAALMIANACHGHGLDSLNLQTIIDHPYLVLFIFFTASFAMGTSVLKQGNSTIVTFPLWFYEYTNCIFWFGFRLCFAITGFTYMCRNRPEWSLNDPTNKTNNTPEAVAQDLHALDKKGLLQLKKRILNTYDVDVLENEQHVCQLFDTLPPATADTMIGHGFKGMPVRTNSMLDVLRPVLNLMAKLNIGAGKRFFTPYIGDPLYLRFGLETNRLCIPFPFLGNVGIHEIEWRGEKQATMVYDNQPWQDYFRVLDDGKKSGRKTILGVWCVRELAGGWFILTEINELSTKELMAQ